MSKVIKQKYTYMFFKQIERLNISLKNMRYH